MDVGCDNDDSYDNINGNWSGNYKDGGIGDDNNGDSNNNIGGDSHAYSHGGDS